MIIAVNDFVKRQVKDSGKTYARSMSFDSIAKHAEDQMSKGCFSAGYWSPVNAWQTRIAFDLL